MWETQAPSASPKEWGEGWDSFIVPRFAPSRHFHGFVWQLNSVGGTMPLGKRWIGCMLIGIGLMLFGVSRQHWQERAGFAVLAAGVVLVLPTRITGGSPT